MKRMLLFAMVALVPTVATPQDSSAVVRQEAEKCVKALAAADYERFAPCTHRRVLEMMGGKETMVATLKRTMDEMRSQGVSFESATVGEPGKPRKIGNWLVAFVPQHIVMKVPQGRVEQDGNLLGISEDDGKKWVFIDVSPITQEQLAQVFPEVAGQIDLPVKQQPVFTKE